MNHLSDCVELRTSSHQHLRTDHSHSIYNLLPPKAVPFQVRPVTSWKGRVEISCPAAATPMITLVPHPLWQASRAALCHQETISGQHHINLIQTAPGHCTHTHSLPLIYLDIAQLRFIINLVFSLHPGKNEIVVTCNSME